jgi:hypothetical protein
MPRPARIAAYSRSGFFYELSQFNEQRGEEARPAGERLKGWTIPAVGPLAFQEAAHRGLVNLRPPEKKPA